MKSRVGPHAWSITLAVIVLGGCNGSQTQVDPIALTQNVTQSGLMRSSILDRDGVAHHGQSWMAREGPRMGPLLYVSDDGDNLLYVFSLPGGKLVGTITGFFAIRGACSDKAGNVFVVDYEAASIKEYRHGAKEPIAVLNDPEGFPWGCSVDPTTGNLAVANLQTVNGSNKTEPGDISIYTNAKGKPQDYADSNMAEVSFDSYDGKGNLYVSGVGDSGQNSTFAVLHKAGSKLTDLTLNQSFSSFSALQWDGQYLAVASRNDANIYRFKINGTKGTKIGAFTLVGASSVYDFWIQDNELYAPVLSNSQPMVGFYSYPKGGRPMKRLLGFASAYGVTVSLRP